MLYEVYFSTIYKTVRYELFHSGDDDVAGGV